MRSVLVSKAIKELLFTILLLTLEVSSPPCHLERSFGSACFKVHCSGILYKLVILTTSNHHNYLKCTLPGAKSPSEAKFGESIRIIFNAVLPPKIVGDTE